MALKIILNLIAITIFVLCLIFLGLSHKAEGTEINSLPRPENIRTIYLGSDNIFSEKKIAELEKIFTTTNANQRLYALEREQ